MGLPHASNSAGTIFSPFANFVSVVIDGLCMADFQTGDVAMGEFGFSGQHLLRNALLISDSL